MARRDRVPRPPAAVPAGAYAQPQIWTLTSTFHLRSATPCPVAEVAASSPPALPIVFLGVCHHLVCSNSPVRRARGNCAATTLFVSNGQCTSKTAPVCRKSSPAPGVTKHNNFVAPWHHTRSLRPPTPKGPSTESGGSGIDTSNDGPSGHRQSDLHRRLASPPARRTWAVSGTEGPLGAACERAGRIVGGPHSPQHPPMFSRHAPPTLRACLLPLTPVYLPFCFTF